MDYTDFLIWFLAIKKKSAVFSSRFKPGVGEKNRKISLYLSEDYDIIFSFIIKDFIYGESRTVLVQRELDKSVSRLRECLAFGKARFS